MTLNRPYTFELAAMALADPGQQDDIKALAERNGVGPNHFERAVLIVTAIGASGERIEDFVRREYILDGWLHGYLPLDASPNGTSLTTWKLGQFAEAHYRS
ncbi:hypothetical protein [Mycolicibacterium obuense]|jgi:hypothetical protein|uniref:Uncharacterized protein n=1 Tax=Mycolicibacterium obuense TaxID=1807 RepID=A0A0M2K708_9MYCO|nr:hypothetical protein [Mycolicibacterium obuense]KKF02778.1 hypothetical protein WN67_06720 [Mycolicibacterium obuense]